MFRGVYSGWLDQDRFIPSSLYYGTEACYELLSIQWVVQGAVDVYIASNPSTEGGEDEAVDDQAVKVVDIIDNFRLQVKS